MPLADRDIIITPNRGQSSEPNIAFRGADAASSATVTLRVYNSSTVGSISFEGNAGQLMSVVDSLSGTIFSVNDISGMPSIEVLDTGEIRLAQYGGGVNISGITTVTNTTNASSTLTGALQVRGGAGIGGNLYVGGTIFGLASVSGTISTATSLAGGSLGQIPYQTAAGVTGFISTGTSGSILQMGAATTATFVTTGSIHVGTANVAANATTATSAATAYALANTSTTYVGFANLAANATTATSAATAYALANTGTTYVGNAITSTNIRGGANGSIPYQTAAGATQFIGIGAAGTILQSNGSTASFVTTGSLIAGIANQVTTVAQTTNATYFLTFVDANNATATAESVYTTSSFTVNAASGDVRIGGVTTVTNTTNATSTVTGAFQVAGGAGIGRDLYVGGKIYSSIYEVSTASSSAFTIQEFVATAGQTTFTVSAGYTVGSIQVFANGINLASSEYTASNGSTVVVNLARNAGDVIRVMSLLTAVSGTSNYLAGGAAGQIAYQSSPGVTAFTGGSGTTGNVLVSNGTSAPAFQNTLTLAGTTAASSTNTGALQVRGGVGIGGNLYAGLDGYFNATRVGRGAGAVVSNTVLGNGALDSNSTGTDNIAVGYLSLNSNTTGRYNTAVGSNTLSAQTTDYHNTALGYNALKNNSGASYNVAVGSSAGSGLSTAQYSVGIGYEALKGNTTVTGNYNTAVGGQSITLITSGTRNTGVGYQSLYQVSNQSYNTAVGAYSQINNYGGSYNTSLGDNSLYAATTGQYNIAIGYQAGNSITTGTSNTIIGSVSGTAGMTATVIVAAGTAERFRIDSVGNMGIGTTTPSALLDVNGTVGVRSATNATSSSTGALQVTGGAGIGGDLWVGGTAYATVLQATSDVNFKKDITTITNALNTVLQLRGVEYKWKHNDEPGLGLIAQEVQPLVPAAVAESGDRLTVGYGNMVGLLVEAIKEQQQQILALQQEIRDLKR